MSGTTDVKLSVPIKAESVRGIREVTIYLIENGKERQVLNEKKNGELNLDYLAEISLTEATSQIKVVVSDGRIGKETEGIVNVYVNMEVVTLNIASQPLANTGHNNYPGVYGLLSLNDMKTYSVDYALESADNAKNVDLCFFCMGKGSKTESEPRLYPINGEKQSDFKGSSANLNSASVKNTTLLLKLTDFDYNNATVTSISSKIPGSMITAKFVKPIAVGDIIAFKTASASTAGADRIGVMKIMDITPSYGEGALNSVNTQARVLTVEIKIPKKK